MKTIWDILPFLGPLRTIIEIGCEKMTDTARLRGMFPDAEIYCFEPDPRNIEFIARNTLGRKLNARVFTCALGEVEGIVPFYQSDVLPGHDGEWTKSSSLKKPANHNGNPHWMTFKKPIEVWCETLDRISERVEIDTVDFVWMDAQSAENMIIRGGRKTFARTHYLYTEHCTDGNYEDEPGLTGILKELPNWRTLEIWKRDVLLENTARRCTEALS